MGKRYVTEFVLNQPASFVEAVSKSFFDREGFALTKVGEEYVWKKGVGALTAPQFIKIGYQNGVVHLEAWLKMAILPGVYCGEMGLDGFFGAVPKNILKTRVQSLITMLCQSAAQQSASAPVQNPVPPVSGAASTNIPSQG